MFIEPGVLHDVVGILGNPSPAGSRVCHNTTLRSSGARGLEVSRCYRHIAPLERKAKRNHPPSAVASPFPSLNRANPRLRQRGHVAPLGLKIFVCAAFYKHAAPLGLNTPMDSPLLTFSLSHFPPSCLLVFWSSGFPVFPASLTSRRASGAGTGAAAASGSPSVASVLTDPAVQPGHRPAVPTHR